jgi:hypothetical protein
MLEKGMGRDWLMGTEPQSDKSRKLWRPLYSRVTADNDYVLCISKKPEGRILNVFTIKKQ